ncbi:hypothetical protein C7M84_009187 [Penaeus vannamei]|uniref:Uncharacterized protein n=1 Tax=Penaeus vannamei TaxID=6689 RepID=A0A3R7P0Z0_PENVA|nr:hypothetical protein C7M84_009187 [Penaeus vannamei]
MTSRLCFTTFGSANLTCYESPVGVIPARDSGGLSEGSAAELLRMLVKTFPPLFFPLPTSYTPLLLRHHIPLIFNPLPSLPLSFSPFSFLLPFHLSFSPPLSPSAPSRPLTTSLPPLPNLPFVLFPSPTDPPLSPLSPPLPKHIPILSSPSPISPSLPRPLPTLPFSFFLASPAPPLFPVIFPFSFPSHYPLPSPLPTSFPSFLYPLCSSSPPSTHRRFEPPTPKPHHHHSLPSRPYSLLSAILHVHFFSLPPSPPIPSFSPLLCLPSSLPSPHLRSSLPSISPHPFSALSSCLPSLMLFYILFQFFHQFLFDPFPALFYSWIRVSSLLFHSLCFTASSSLSSLHPLFSSLSPLSLSYPFSSSFVASLLPIRSSSSNPPSIFSASHCLLPFSLHIPSLRTPPPQPPSFSSPLLPSLPCLVYLQFPVHPHRATFLPIASLHPFPPPHFHYRPFPHSAPAAEPLFVFGLFSGLAPGLVSHSPIPLGSSPSPSLLPPPPVQSPSPVLSPAAGFPPPQPLRLLLSLFSFIIFFCVVGPLTLSLSPVSPLSLPPFPPPSIPPSLLPFILLPLPSLSLSSLPPRPSPSILLPLLHPPPFPLLPSSPSLRFHHFTHYSSSTCAAVPLARSPKERGEERGWPRRGETLGES